METERVDVLYNDCYGGFGISKEALNLYNKKLLDRNPDAEKQTTDFLFNRTDPILLEVFYEMGGENCENGKGFNGRCAKIVVDKIPKIYKDYYRINEYDGKEDVYIDYYNFDHVVNIKSFNLLECIKSINQIIYSSFNKIFDYHIDNQIFY